MHSLITNTVQGQSDFLNIIRIKYLEKCEIVKPISPFLVATTIANCRIVIPLQDAKSPSVTDIDSFSIVSVDLITISPSR